MDVDVAWESKTAVPFERAARQIHDVSASLSLFLSDESDLGHQQLDSQSCEASSNISHQWEECQ